jgi:dihydrodipicolinate synthase/N-acetylneuraminate lyase
VGAVSGLASVFPSEVASVVHDATAEGAAALGERRAALERFPRHAAFKHLLGRRGVPVRPDVRAPLRPLTDAEARELDAWLAAA